MWECYWLPLSPSRVLALWITCEGATALSQVCHGEDSQQPTGGHVCYCSVRTAIKAPERLAILPSAEWFQYVLIFENTNFQMLPKRKLRESLNTDT